MQSELEELRKENERLRKLIDLYQDSSIVDSLPVLISFMDTDLKYSYVNRAYEKWFNVKVTDLIGVSVRDFVGEDVFSKAYPFFKRALAGESVSFEQESRYPSGTKYIHVFYVPRKDLDSGKVIGIIALVYDISERIREERLEKAKQALQEEELQRLLNLFEEAPIPMAMVEGPDHRFVSANKYYRKDFIKGEYLNRPMREVLPDAIEQGFANLLEEVYASGKPFIGTEVLFTLTTEGKSKDFYFNFVYQPVKNSSGIITGILAVLSDVTELVIATNQLIEQRDIRERFVSTLTHDLRTPLTAARLSSHLLQKKSNDPAAVHGLASRLEGSLRRAEYMVRDLLDANLINAGQGLPITKRTTDLNLLVEEAMLDLVYVHGNRFHLVRMNSEIKGEWDGEALKRVTENLLSNALKYGTPDSEVTITTGLVNGSASLSVHNTGNPIPESELPFLFDRFKRASSAVKSGKSGWGIGLSLVKALAEAHGGTVTVASSERDGTTFTLTLPL